MKGISIKIKYHGKKVWTIQKGSKKSASLHI
jgi:hypothetical protein